jgi:hypothetical protein
VTVLNINPKASEARAIQHRAMVISLAADLSKALLSSGSVGDSLTPATARQIAEFSMTISEHLATYLEAPIQEFRA